MFRGVSTLTLDSKGRMAMPARYRERLDALSGGQLVVTVSLVDRDEATRPLWVYTLPEFEEAERKLVSLPTFDRVAHNARSLFVGYAHECELDSHGRILIPPKLRDYAGLEREAVLAGMVNKFELWNEARWNRRSEALLGEALEAALPDALANLSF